MYEHEDDLPEAYCEPDDLSIYKDSREIVLDERTIYVNLDKPKAISEQQYTNLHQYCL